MEETRETLRLILTRFGRSEFTTPVGILNFLVIVGTIYMTMSIPTEHRTLLVVFFGVLGLFCVVCVSEHLRAIARLIPKR